MKHAFLILTLVGGSFAFGQSESRVEMKYERYENGELKEDKYYLEENGQVIAGEDFDTPEFLEMEAKMAAKRLEMDQRMQDMQMKADQMMQKARQDMDLRMQKMQQRMNQMQQEMDMKMQQQKPAQSPQMAPPANNSTPNSLGTTFQT
jgi:septin family protein